MWQIDFFFFINKSNVYDNEDIEKNVEKKRLRFVV